MKRATCFLVVIASVLAFIPQVVFAVSRKADKLNRQGAALLAKGELDAAAAKFRKAIELEPNYAPPHTNLCIVLLQKQEASEALAECQQAVRADPDDSGAHFTLGQALLATENLDPALTEFREAARLQPRDPDAHLYLGKILEEKGDLNGAIAEYRTSYQLNPGGAPAREAYERLTRQTGLVPVAPTPPVQPTTSPDAGTVSGSVYTSQFFGFSYPFPEGWHVQSRQAQEKVPERGHEYLYRENPNAASSESAAEHQAGMQRTFFLFGATEKEETEMAPPSVQIVAFDLYSERSTPGLDEIIQALTQGFKAAGARELGPHGELRVADHQFVTIQLELPVNPSGHPGAPTVEEWALTVHGDYALGWHFVANDGNGLERIARTLNGVSFTSKVQAAAAPARQAEVPSNDRPAKPTSGFQDEGTFLIYGEKNKLIATDNFKWQSDGSYSSECVSSESRKPQTRQTTITPDKTGEWADIHGTIKPKQAIELVREGNQVSARVNGKPTGTVIVKPGMLPFHFNVGDYEPALFSLAIRLYDKSKTGEQELPLFDFLTSAGNHEASGTLTMGGTRETQVAGQSLRLTEFGYDVFEMVPIGHGLVNGSYWPFSFWADEDGKIYVGRAADLAFVRKGYESLLSDPRLKGSPLK